MHRQDVRQQLPVVGLQVLHVLLLLGRLQLPDKVQPAGDFRLLAVHDLADDEHHQEGHVDQEAFRGEKPE